ALAAWHPAVDSTELIDGGERRINHLGAVQLVEPIVDRGDRHYTFRMSEPPLPLQDFESTLRVRDDGPGRCEVQWEATYQAAGVSDTEADELVRGFFVAGLDAL
ncbi:MAG TPA: SRPBCC family protein, partial [Acidimicrobiales bacterium]|nr:SRPBCC family protein [Acidimicrobiales bacterium]